MNVLITGGCGFAGSNIAIALKKKYKQYNIIVFDNLKRRGSELSLHRLKELDIDFVHGDIRNPEDFDDIEMDIDVVVDCSAEPSVVAGINSLPTQTVNINLVGTINILNFALRNNSIFIFLSTSRVYPIRKLNEIKYTEDHSRFQIDPIQSMSGITSKGISEKFSLNGFRSIYGASKLASELLIAEYVEFYNLKAVINRCGVIAGPYQMGKVDQGVTVLWVARHFWRKKLSYFGYGGTGKQVRDVLHIKDLISLLDKQIHDIDTFSGETINVGGGMDSSFSLLELTKHCELVTGNSIQIDSVKETRVADIPIYVTDNEYLESLCDWRIQYGVKEIVSDIFDWLTDNEKLLEPILK